jgi:hypothetical protein
MKNLTLILAGLIWLCLLASCEKDNNQPIDCAAGGPSVTATATSASCGNNNGSLQVTGTGGKAPYQYSIDGNTFASNNNFPSLVAGNYTVTIKDANNCTGTVAAAVRVSEGSISYEAAVKNIIATNCAIAGCHVGGTGRTNFTSFATIQATAAEIKTKTGNRSMPVGRMLSNEQIQQIACWVDAGAPNN